MRRIAVFIFLVTSAMLAVAQGRDTVYRTVGPDGKVTYSQVPPAAAQAQRKLEFDRLPASALPPEVARFREEMERNGTARQKAAALPAGSLRLFSAKWCGYCRQAKSWLTANGVAFSELDIDTPGGMAEFAQAASKGGIPLLVGPNVRVQGFSTEAYDSALGRR